MSKRYAEMTEEQKERERARHRQWRQANPERIIIQHRQWYQANREKKQSYNHQYQLVNPEKVSARHRKWQQVNPEKARIYVRKYQQANPDKVLAKIRKRRAIKNGQTEHFTEYEWKLLCEQYDQRCLRCGEKKPLTADHVMPLIMGGRDTIDNIQPLCLNCNSSKGARYVDYRNREPIKVKQLSFYPMMTV